MKNQCQLEMYKPFDRVKEYKPSEKNKELARIWLEKIRKNLSKTDEFMKGH
jgi:hypothetical protein